MTQFLGRFLAAGLLVTMTVGCEPRPVVVDPDDDGTTVIEDDADIDVVPDGTTTQPETGVNVNVGGQETDSGTSGTGTSGADATDTNPTGTDGAGTAPGTVPTTPPNSTQ